MRRALGLLLALLFGPLAGCAPESTTGEPRGQATDSAPRFVDAAAASADTSFESAGALGRGFVVWESNRSQHWRIWTRDLAPSEPKLLSPDEDTRQHCCAHISPDGRRIAYLSYPDSMAGYADGGSEGVLHLVRRDGTGNRVLAPSARSSWESRAAVWRTDDELIYIRGDGATVLHDLRDDRIEVLVEAPDEIDTKGAQTWLVNSRLSHAVSGLADFAPYERSQGVAPRRTYGGCQPYFSHDGRWGFWAAGAGGPVNRVDLATGEISTILAKSDPRIPDGLGYAYFPMVSRDGLLFAFAASDYQHNHFLADYEIFVAPSDPETLELVGDAVRMTFDPATDRFPDVFLEPLPLGRFRGEAPFEVVFEAPDANQALTWDFGDGATASGPSARHTFERPGTFEVSARAASQGGSVLHGLVTVAPAAAPRPTGVLLRQEGRSVVVHFDEQIAAERPVIRFESGVAVSGWSVEAGGRALAIEPARRIDGFDRLFLEGVSDRAQSPNRIEPLELEVTPPLWPSDRRGLSFVWETGDAPNLVWDDALGSERATSLASAGRAFLDHNFAMRLDGGRFVASAADAGSILEAGRKSNELSVEAVIEPAPAPPGGLRRIISFSGGTRQSRNFLLAQKRNRLVFSPRSGSLTQDGRPEVEIASLPAGRPTHVLIAYRAGRLAAYVDGERVLETDSVQGGFYHWKPRPLLFGDGPRGGETWKGTLEGVAVYSRFIEADEARENHLRYRRKLAERRNVVSRVVDATLTARSETPDLREISPYREALAVYEYRLDRVVAGPAPPDILRVAHWTILDGETLEIDRSARIGESLRLTLEPFEDNPQLESLYLADTLEPRGGPLFYALQP